MSCRALLVVACAALLLPAVARADGDPASDYLIGQNVFVPFGGQVSTSDGSRLAALLDEATKRGFRIKVAVIAAPTDLGSVTALWRKPQRYAEFLGQELYFVYKGRLLIVMPNGYGISHRGKPVPAERKVLDALPVPGQDLAGATTTAVRRLAAARGVDVPLPSGGSSSANRDRAIIAAVAAAVALVAGIVALLRRRRGTRYA